VDWDGVGTFAMFIASGAVGLGIIALRAYKARLASKLDFARLQRERDVSDEDVQEQIRDLEDQVQRLTERVDFTEKLLSSGSRDAGEND
jgi:Mg2+ and Co2+ transporter CorA